MKIGHFKFEIKSFAFAGKKTLKITIEVNGEIFAYEQVFEDDDFKTTFRRYMEMATWSLEDAILTKKDIAEGKKL